MKKITVLAIMMALALLLAGCGLQSAPSSSESSEPSPSAASEEAPSASDAAEPSSSAAAPSQSVDAITWNDAATADDAAKGAGFGKFGVMDKVTIDDVDYVNPTFSYAGGVAQAAYEQGAIGLYVRKADGTHDAPLSDRDTTEFAQKWTKSYEGLDVTLYGPAKGAAPVLTWSDGTQDFGVTYQGLGGEEVTLDSDDVDAIVKGLKDANAKVQPKQDNQSEQSTQNNNADDDDDDADDDDDSDESSEANMTISEGDAEAAAEDASGGTTVSSYQDYVDGHGWVWVVTTNDSNGNENTYYVDNYGNAYNAEFDSNSSTDLSLSEDDACAIAEDASGGKTTGAYPEQTEEHGLCWHVTTEDDNGNVNEYHVDNDGNAFNIDFE